jgi:methyl-accepting chemotaxis protein
MKKHRDYLHKFSLGYAFILDGKQKIIAHPQEKSGEKAADSWAKKIYEV